MTPVVDDKKTSDIFIEMVKYMGGAVSSMKL